MTIDKTSTAKWILPPELKSYFDRFVTLYGTVFKKPEKRRPLLIQGAPGVGKSLFAHAFEVLYQRDYPELNNEDVKRVNVSALAENIFESEIFGHIRGAFTGALADKKGFLENTRLLILEEIGELSKPTQAKLLTFMEDGIYYRVGDTKPRKSPDDIQIIATTNTPLDNTHFRQTTQMRNLDYRDYLRVYLPKPSPTEQKTISRMLNLTNEALAAAAAKLTVARRLKTALMQQLFTRGIPGRHSRFKTARVFRHVFDVPDCWDVESLRNSVVSIEYGTNAPSNDSKHGFPVVAIPEVIASRFRLGECSYAEVPDAEANSLRLKPDDVLLIRTNGNADYIGKSTVIGDEATEQYIIYASYLIRIRTNKDKLSGSYLNYFLASPLGRRLCLAMANTSAGNHNLGSRAIKQFLLPRPSPDESGEIVALVDAAEDSIEAVQQEIVTLERLTRSLLQNLLTGKVRVKPLETSL